MKKLFLFLLLVMPVVAFCQAYNILSWTRDGAIENGIKIQTNIPSNENYTAIINIDGYNYGDAELIGLKIAWKGEEGQFRNSSAVAVGGFAPRIFLSNEEGKVAIYLKAIRAEDLSINVSTVFQPSEEQISWYSGWSISDELSDGHEIIYKNSFTGDTHVEGLLTAKTASLPEAFLGNASVSNTLDVSGDVTTRGSLIVGNRPPQSCTSDVQPKFSTDFFSYLTPPVSIGEPCYAKVSQYALAVNGTAIFTKAKVALNSTWPDFVFKADYKLPSLKDLEQYLQTYNHLPDVPAEEEVKKDGIDLGENQALLLKKIEELTLYVIQQNKQQKADKEALTKQLMEQQKLIASQQELLSLLREQLLKK